MKSNDPRRKLFIGLDVEILASSCPSQVGVRGRIVDETKNTISIDHDGVVKVIAKGGCKFSLVDGDATHTISGDEIMFRPEDRIKRVR